MTIYRITTEGDCEGRTTKVLGYVEANSPEHAMKYLKSIGRHEYYEYWVSEVENPLLQACAEDDLSHLSVTLKHPSYEGGEFHGTVTDMSKQ